jgi:hypothetical protein
MQVKVFGAGGVTTRSFVWLKSPCKLERLSAALRAGMD